jgi:membrane dipeptidase
VRPIIDSHLDLAWNAVQWNRDLARPLEEVRRREAHMTDKRARGRGTVSLPELRRGGVAVCLGTILVRAKDDVRPEKGFGRTDLDVATQEIASAVGQGQLAYYRLLERRSEISIIATRSQLLEHWRAWQQGDATPDRPVGLIVAMEGADPIVDPRQAQWWWERGLRCVGLAHYGKGHYAVGTGDAGPLTPRGLELLRELERLGMILDLTHSSDPSFFQALDAFGGAVMASHNNCRALVPGDRQYSDEQVRRLIERGAVIGVALDAWMLREGYVIGQTPGDDVPLSAVVDHVDRICQLAGSARHVGIGSDLDGGFGTAQTPAGIETIADLQKLAGLLADRGYADADIDRIFHGNWLRFFSEHLPEA